MQELNKNNVRGHALYNKVIGFFDIAIFEEYFKMNKIKKMQHSLAYLAGLTVKQAAKIEAGENGDEDQIALYLVEAYLSGKSEE